MRAFLRYLKIFSLCTVVVVVLVFLALSALHGEAVASVQVTLKEGAIEPQDASFFGLAKHSRLPDYRLQLRATGSWYDLGVIRDRSARRPLTYIAEDAIPVARLTALRLLEADKLGDTAIEQHTVTDLSVSGRSYLYLIRTEYRFAAGLRWASATVFGQALLVFAMLAGLAWFIGGVGRIVPE